MRTFTDFMKPYDSTFRATPGSSQTVRKFTFLCGSAYYYALYPSVLLDSLKLGP